MPVRAPLLTLRELNRALLARQMLLERRRLGVVEAIERLGCLQGQWAPAPYVSLWSRLAEFDRERLTHAIDKREVASWASWQTPLDTLWWTVRHFRAKAR